MKKKRYKILVTGADGFIGSHLTERLVKQGHQVSAFTFYNSFGLKGWLDYSNKEIRNKINFISGDIRDNQAVKNAVKGVDIIYHLAALIGIPHSYTSAESYLDTNVKGTLNVLMAAREYNTKKIIHTSTSEVYGTAKFVPMTEDHPIIGQSPYSASKIAADQLAISFYNSFNLPVTIIRPFNTFGPRQSGRAIIPTIISQYLKQSKSIKIGSLKPLRDFNYIEDTVNAFISCIDAKKIEGEIINIGSGKDFSIRCILEIISKYFNKSIKVKIDKKRIRPKKSEVLRLCSSNKKAKKLLNWNPGINSKKDFERKIIKTIEWYKKNLHIFEIKSNDYNT